MPLPSRLEPPSPRGQWPADLERELLAHGCYYSFWHFVRHAYGAGHLDNPEGGWLDPHVHKPFCDWLQSIVERWLADRKMQKQERWYILVDAARNTGKSVIVTKALTAWIHLRSPDTTSVIDSVTMDLSLKFADVIRKLWSAADPYALFPWLYGRWDGTDTWTRSRFDSKAKRINVSEASIECASVEVGIAGRHPSHAVTDDPITIEKLREKGNWIELSKKHVDALYPALQNYSLYIICATPYADNDVLTTVMREDGIREVHGHPLPKEYAEFIKPTGKWFMYHMPAADEDGNPLVPTRWSKAALDEWARKQPAEYASQGLLRPGSGETVPLTAEQLEKMRCRRKDAPSNLVLSIHLDTAFKSQKRVNSGDESVIEVWGHHPSNGDVYFLEGHGGRWRVEEFTDKLVATVQRLRASGKRIKYLTDEASIGGKHGVWRKHLQSCFANADMFLPPFLEIQRAGHAKEERIREAAGYWVDGHVHLVDDAPCLPRLIWQMSRIGVSAHDDWADAAADVFHPEVYRPFTPNTGTTKPPEPRRPFDNELKGQQQWALNAYDQYAKKQMQSARQPV